LSIIYGFYFFLKSDFTAALGEFFSAHFNRENIKFTSKLKTKKLSIIKSILQKKRYNSKPLQHFIQLCIGVSYVNMASIPQSTNRHLLILNSLIWIGKHNKSNDLFFPIESQYIRGRIAHFLGNRCLAKYYYHNSLKFIDYINYIKNEKCTKKADELFSSLKSNHFNAKRKSSYNMNLIQNQ